MTICAAETLDVIEKAFTKQPDLWSLPDAVRRATMRRPWALLRARRCFYDACHWKARGDRARQRECLDKALATQFYDIEVLIECYQIPDPPAGYRSRIRELIEKRLCELRERIADNGPNHAAAAQALQRVRLAGGQHGGRSGRSPAVGETLAGRWSATTAPTAIRLPGSTMPRVIMPKP